jgi:hypothetical protein
MDGETFSMHLEATYTTYCSNANILCDICQFIDIDFVEFDVGEFLVFAEFLEHGGDHTTRATPSRCEIDCDDIAAIDLLEQDVFMNNEVKIDTYGFVELLLTSQGWNAHNL